MKKENAKPRIALLAMSVIGGAPPHGGIPVLIELFSRLSRDFEIVFYSFQEIHRDNVPAGIIVRSISGRIPGRLRYWMTIVRVICDHIRRPFHLFFAVAAYPPGKAAIFLSKLLRAPSVVQIIALEAVALPTYNVGNLAIPWLAAITRDVCREATHLVAVSGYQARLAKKQLPTDRSIVVLPLRIVTSYFTYRERSLSGRINFIHIAYYHVIKGQDIMFNAFARIAKSIDAKLTVIGAGFNVPEVSTMLDELSIADKIEFLGPIPNDQISVHFRDKHFLLHTARFETGCAVIQEAMASGVVACGTRVGLLDDIGDEFAVVASPESPEELADKIISLVDDEKAYLEMARKAYRWISSEDAEWSARRYSDFLQSASRKNLLRDDNPGKG